MSSIKWLVISDEDEETGVDNFEREIFTSSSATESVTTGVDISETFLPLKEFSKLNNNPEIDSDVLVGFVDTEGQGSKFIMTQFDITFKDITKLHKYFLDKGDVFDLCLFSPILVTSKIVIFWWPGMFLVDAILNNLGAMTKSAQRITQDAQSQVDDIKKLLLEPQQGRSDKIKEHNTIRKLLNDSFESIDIWLFPLSDLSQSREKLLFEDFNENWKQTFKEMRKKVSEQLSVNESKHSTDSFRTLVFRYDINTMNVRYKVEGCNDEGIDAYLCKELEYFQKKLELEGLPNKIVKENCETYSGSVRSIAYEFKIQIASIAMEEQEFRDQVNKSVLNIVLPLSKLILRKSLKELTKPLWCNFNNKVKDSPKRFVQKHQDNLKNFCGEIKQQLIVQNEIAHAKKLTEDAQKDFRTLVSDMNPQYKVVGCDNVGIDAYLYEELENFEKTLTFENFSDKIANETYETYSESVRLIVDRIKLKITTITLEAQEFKDNVNKCVSTITYPLQKLDLTKSFKEITQPLWSNFNNIVKDFPKHLVQQHQENLENFCRETEQHLMVKNEITHAKILAKNAYNEFRTLVNNMSPQYEVEGCDDKGINSYLYEELKNFKRKLESENFSDKIVNETHETHSKSVHLIVNEIRMKIANITIEVQTFKDQVNKSVSKITLPLPKSDLTKSFKELTQPLWSNFNNIVKDSPKDLGQQHRDILENFCKETEQFLMVKNEITRAKIVAENAYNDFCTLVNNMDPQYEVEGCDDKGISAYLYEELKNFKRKLESENLSSKIVNETYETYRKSVHQIADATKIKIANIIIEVQKFQNQVNESVPNIALPLSKSNLTNSFKELIKPLWHNFNNIAKDLPKRFVQQHQENIENFCGEIEQHLMVKNKENIDEIISIAQNKMKENLKKSAKKLNNRLPMKDEKFESEWSVLFKQNKEMYFNLDVFNNFPDDINLTFPENLYMQLSNSIWEELMINNSNAWEKKAEAFLERAAILFKRNLATNFPVNNNKVFNNTEIEHYLQEELLEISYKVPNIFPRTMMDEICIKYKEIASLIVIEFQKKNDKNIEKIPQEIDRYIINWVTLSDINIKDDLENWQHEVAKLLLISTNIPKLVALPSSQLLCICNDITNFDRESTSPFRQAIKLIKQRGMENTLSELFVNEILESLKLDKLKHARMLFINRCLGITSLTPTIRHHFYELLFEHSPFILASPVIRRIFLAEYEEYKEEKHQNVFFDLLKTPHEAFESLPYLQIINDILKKNDPDSPIAALSCDIIQKTFFVHYSLTELHDNFSSAVDSLYNNNMEPLQIISAIAFLKEYVRIICDANMTTLKQHVRISPVVPMANHMVKIIQDINNHMMLNWQRIHSLRIYFLKYLRSCDFSMQDIRDLCKSQEQTFPWLKKIPWGDKDNRFTFNPYWLHHDYEYAEDYYYHVCDESNCIETKVNVCFASYLEIAQSRINKISIKDMLYKLFHLDFSSPNNRTLNKNDLITFAGVIAARLHYIRASYKWTKNEKRVANYLTKEITAMNASSVYKEFLKKLLLNSNSLIQLFKDNEVDENLNRNDSEGDEFLMKSVIIHLIIVHASIPNNASPLAAYLHQLQACRNDFILTIIGNGSTQGDYTRLDGRRITSVPINHEPGYIVEQISTEKTQNVRMMTPQAYRILHLFVHALLGASVPSSIASEFFARNGNNAGDTMKHCLRNIRNDWKVLKEIFNCNNEQLALILHSIIFSMTEKSSSDEWKLDTPEKREDLHAYYMIDTTNKTKFPFLEVFFRHEEKLNLIRNLLPILKFVQILRTRLEYQITRLEAREMTFDNFINRESNNGELQKIYLALNSTFKKFENAWNIVAPHVKSYECLQFKKFPKISSNSSVMFGLVEGKDAGIYLCAIISYLVELQNQFLGEIIAIPFSLCLSLKFLESNVNNNRVQYYLQRVQIQHARPANFIDYERNDEILKYSQRNLEIRYGEDIIYDLYKIEMKLAHQLVFNKCLIVINNTFSKSFPYYGEMFSRNFYVLTDFEKFVTQEPLPIANIDMAPLDDYVFDKSFSSENASRMLPTLEMLICSIDRKINNEISIKDYISQQMDLSILTENTEFCGIDLWCAT
ncbi:18961_t:CDS:2 [Racocetra fulgida]|uniref:18961_t:CDS:1 n=1 Tax=Racocetra fulgida TaxID=60492 RepID=A0A9N9EX09_9GLOM|nr:18961_t:CDS:2 [Racocetra fulgida]